MAKKSATKPTARKKSPAKSKSQGKKTPADPRPYPRLEPDQPLDRFAPADYNPRKPLNPGDPEFERLKRSIEQFGQVQVLVGNVRTGRLVGGHQTRRVLDYLNRDKADVMVIDEPAEREQSLNVALNRIQGGWDVAQLDDLLHGLLDLDADLVDLAGFDATNLDAQLADLNRELGELDQSSEEANGVREDESPDPPSDPVTNPGDLIRLGDHRLLCGDSTNADDVKRLMDGAKADLLLTDPPYGVSYVGGTSDALVVEMDARQAARQS